MGKYRHYQHIVEAVQYNNVAKNGCRSKDVWDKQ